MENITQKPDLGQLKLSEFFKASDCPFDLETHKLYEVISGSHAYGLANKNSDVDIRGVLSTPQEYIFGLNNFEQWTPSSVDVCFYSLKKFFELLLKNNVHALEMAWMDKRSANYIHPIFQKVLNNKEIFMSKRIGYTCGGYAFQQVKLMFVKKANNSGRQELIQKFGCDLKMATHAIRILRMGTEALNTGKLNVFREDAEELLEIKNGKYKLHELAVLGQNEKGQQVLVDGFLKQQFDKFNLALENSTLPKEPNFDEINNLLILLQRELYVK